MSTMDNQHRAAPESSWTIDEKWGADNTIDVANCFIELRTRIEALEAAQQSPQEVSLKNRALKALEEAEHADHPVQLTILNTAAHVLIREALESIPES